MKQLIRIPASLRRLGLIALLLPVTGCVVSETRPDVYTPAAQAQTEVPENRLLDIGIADREGGAVRW